MFLSYGTVPMFAFTILLNFFFLNSPIKSQERGTIYELCQDCLNDTCHKEKNRPCMTRYDGWFLCYTCEIELGDDQFYTLEECKTGCTDPERVCMCTYRYVFRVYQKRSSRKRWLFRPMRFDNRAATEPNVQVSSVRHHQHARREIRYN
ncbi:uncharacterized protein LOC115034091 [Acyrthosiphon pisum]|uniref:Uncharacterized protein n=1 Tax=Acyrthosiphon pisum TaxID=7029 RepID=A0A8R2JSZ7_ACYPI|nr:uncharacterized protein LOC115034091 [Acyrthosiphon pisum]